MEARPPKGWQVSGLRGLETNLYRLRVMVRTIFAYSQICWIKEFIILAGATELSSAATGVAGEDFLARTYRPHLGILGQKAYVSC